VTPDSSFYSVLSLPYINILLDEYQGNNYGTNDAIDRSFAICQYDATWRSDYGHGRPNTNRGFTLFFPKFMKAQRTYSPTPLSNFQRLQFSILDPENQPLSTAPDCSLIQRLMWSSDVSGSCYADPSGAYLFIQLRDYVPVWTFSHLDKVIFDGLTFTSNTGATQAAGKQTIQWLQRSEGHIIVGTGYSEMADISGSTIAVVHDGANTAGYTNWIIVRNRFSNPSTGSTQIQPFSATGDDSILAQEFAQYPPSFQAGGVLNLSRQVQMVLRVITRDFDSASNIRPDNV
jgi:hypothetical protein